MDHASTSSVRPDRPLTVKCALDRSTRRIQFTSARNCSISLLKTKVEECFSLPRGSFTIAYKDDDGETMDIVTDADLTEAVLYFQSGVDDVPISSAASYYSGRSVGSRKITLRVHVQVEYDGPSLSDTSSMIGHEDDRDGEDDDPDFRDAISLTDSYDPNKELEDDSVTISSRDTGQASMRNRLSTGSSLNLGSLRGSLSNNHLKLGPSSKTIVASKHRTLDSTKAVRALSPLVNEVSNYEGSDSASSSEFSAAARFPADPSAVFERLKLLDPANPEAPPQAQIERGKLWLLDQSSRTTLAPLIGPESDAASSAPDLSVQGQEVTIEDDLALQQDRRGRYYYTYTGGSSSASQSQFQDNSSEYQEQSQTEEEMMEREALLPLNRSASSSSRPITRTISDPLPTTYIDVPEDLLPFIDTPTPPAQMITDCSSCGQQLDSIRYICSTCGEKRPCMEPPDVEGKGKGRQSHSRLANGYADTSNSPGSPFKDKPLPGIPHPLQLSMSLPASLPLRRHTSDSDSLDNSKEGYELCSNCIQIVGISHAVEGTVAPNDSAHIYPPSPDSNSAISAMRRSAPKRKGLMRHAYLEKMWAGNCWKEVEQDMLPRCSVCSSALSSVIYKCSACDRFELCRACYSQVHEIHPSHAFIVVGDSTRSVQATPPSPQRHFSDPITDLPHDVESMVHPGVKCAHCMLDIVGARFHCAICDSVDICSNCESAGLPGNLTSDDGGHDSSHIMIKIPYPQESAQVQMVSRKAVHLWQDRDAPNLTNGGPPRRRSNSVDSDRARTVIGGGTRGADSSEGLAQKRSHDMNCRACGKNIIGVRYQCATCPSLPTSYNLCSDCEPLSYLHHDPMHCFLKIIRPVDRKIESPFGLLPGIYKSPAGTRPDGLRNIDDPQDYLRSLYHHTALCDVCMERIRGEWYRCAYCAKDLCRDHEAMDTHNRSHLFIVFKSSVDMAVYRNFTDLENPALSPPLIPFAVYNN